MALGVAFAALVAASVSFYSHVARTQEEAPTPRATIAPVDWGAAEEDAEATGRSSARPEDSRTMAAATSRGATAIELKLPLLLPASLIQAGRENQLDQPLRLSTREYAYSAVAEAAPRSYLIQGTRHVFQVEGVDEAAASRPPINVERTDYGVEASFIKYGVIYSVAIFCADPNNDPECAQEDRVRALAEDMTFAE